MKIKVLIACEESQTVCKAFRELGHEAFSCDLKPCSGGHPEWHIQGDASSYAHAGAFDLLIAHPPCTFLSNAGACRMYPKAGLIDANRFKKALEAKKFFLKFLASPMPFVCIENPRPLAIVDLPAAQQTIQPYQFGHPYSKKTLLWLKGLPKLKHTEVLSEFKPFIAHNTSNNKGKTIGQKFATGSTNRSKTFQGIAEAMAAQWSEYIIRSGYKQLKSA
jgi:hypothetical protein